MSDLGGPAVCEMLVILLHVLFQKSSNSERLLFCPLLNYRLNIQWVAEPGRKLKEKKIKRKSEGNCSLPLLVLFPPHLLVGPRHEVEVGLQLVSAHLDEKAGQCSLDPQNPDLTPPSKPEHSPPLVPAPEGF